MRFIRGAACWAVVTAAVTGAALALGPSAPALGSPAPSWPQTGYNAAQTAFNPHETQLSTGNVHELVTRAIARVANPDSGGTPAVAGGMVFVASSGSSFGGARGKVQAFPETCGAPLGLSCQPIWTATVGQFTYGSVAVADNEVFVDSDTLATVPHQKLWVFGEHCATGGAACTPLWTATINGDDGSGDPPTVAGGTVYLPGGPPNNAYLYAYPVKCATICKPTWRGKMAVGNDDAPAAVGDGFVFVSDYGGFLYAYRVGCATGGKECKPAWEGNTGSLDPGPVAYANGQVFVSSNGVLYAYKAAGCGISGFECSATWHSKTHAGAGGALAIAYGLVYAASGNAWLFAFKQHCASTCLPTWKAHLAPRGATHTGSPAVANGVVYLPWGDILTGRESIAAFSATCATGGGTCSPLADVDGGSYIEMGGPAVAGGELWATGGPRNGRGDLYAFGLPVP
jgi:hypothetical protein